MKQTLAIIGLLAFAPAVFAQNQTQTTKADPIQCWWRTTAGAVRAGETFSAVLTCAVLETADVKVVPDQSKLEPSVVQFAPFEVAGGSHPADLHTDDRRFFQYEYRLRVISENLFGKDAAIPETKISYRVQSHTGAGGSAGSNAPKETIEGRDQTYLMPPLSVRVLSLVPSDAADIRDAGAEGFGDLDNRAFQANLLTVVGGVLFVVAGLLALLAVVRLVARYRKPTTEADRLIPDSAVLRAVGRELSDVQRAREGGGWSPGLAARALAALRVAATYALGRKVAKETQASVEQRQSAAQKVDGVLDGQIVLNAGWRVWRRKPIVVSAAATSQNIAREIARLSARNGGGQRVEELQTLHDALARFTAAEYGRAEKLEDAQLDESIAATGAVIRRLTFAQTWPMRRFRGTPAAAPASSKVWSR